MKIILSVLLILSLSLQSFTPKAQHSQPQSKTALDVPVVLAARFTVTPQGRAEFLRLANAALEPTRKEPGCISYDFYQKPDDENTFIYFEQWQSRQALAEHLKQPYTQKLLNAFGGFLEGEADVRIYDVKSMSYGLDNL